MLPYLSTDRKDVKGDPVFGRGEVWVKGGNVGLGYYMMPDETKKEFEEDGWFHTGDIGQFASDGSLQIVDRKKNLSELCLAATTRFRRVIQHNHSSVTSCAPFSNVPCSQIERR